MKECTKCKGNNIELDRTFNYHNIFRCKDCDYWTYDRHDECCRNPFKIIVIDRKDINLYFIREQCYHCGGCINKNKPLSSKEFGGLISGELDLYRESKYWKNYKEEKAVISSMKKEYRYYNSQSHKYNLYLLSPEWKRIRKNVFDRDNNICQECKTNTATEVHHLTYDNIYNEVLNDLISICQGCHEKIHKPPATE